MAKSPAQIVTEKFGDKQKLVDAVKTFVNDDLWVARENQDKGLAHVSNAKLLRLHDIFSAVKGQFGTRAKLIDAVIEAAGKGKDTGYRTRIEGWPVPRLFDAYKSLTKAAKAAKKPADKAEKKPAAKAEAKSAAAKKADKAEAKPAKKTAKKG